MSTKFTALLLILMCTLTLASHENLNEKSVIKEGYVLFKNKNYSKHNLHKDWSEIKWSMRYYELISIPDQYHNSRGVQTAVLRLVDANTEGEDPKPTEIKLSLLKSISNPQTDSSFTVKLKTDEEFLLVEIDQPISNDIDTTWTVKKDSTLLTSMLHHAQRPPLAKELLNTDQVIVGEGDIYMEGPRTYVEGTYLMGTFTLNKSTKELTCTNEMSSFIINLKTMLHFEPYKEGFKFELENELKMKNTMWVFAPITPKQQSSWYYELQLILKENWKKRYSEMDLDKYMDFEIKRYQDWIQSIDDKKKKILFAGTKTRKKIDLDNLNIYRAKIKSWKKRHHAEEV